MSAVLSVIILAFRPARSYLLYQTPLYYNGFEYDHLYFPLCCKMTKITKMTLPILIVFVIQDPKMRMKVTM